METLETSASTHALKKFFSEFGFNLITISIQPEIEGAYLPQGKWFTPKNRVRAVPLDIFYSDEFQKELQDCQVKGNAVYFLINEGNGVPTDPSTGNLNCGKRVNITTLRTLAIDTDTADFDLLWEKLKQIKLAPHYVIESSPKKYHLYFIIKPLPAEGDNIFKWQALQKLLDDLIPNLDQSMTDINQVLRVPSFYNLKPTLNPSFKVRIHKQCLDLDPYDLQFLYDRLGAYKYDEFLHEVNGNGNGHSFKDTYNKFEFPKNKLSPGERRNTICRFMEHLMENILPLNAKEEDYFIHVDAFIMKYLTQADQPDFLEGGKRRQNLLNYFKDQSNYRIRKSQAKEVEALNKQMKEAENVHSKCMPDEFYLNFPGDLGMIVKEISSYAPNLPKELAFASALMISGALKAESFRFKGAWPFVNGLVIAGTGVGKSTIKDIVERTLASCGLRGKYPQLLGFQNSVQSLHTALYTAGGAGTVIVDESGDYLQTITGKNAPGYAKALKKYFKEATTGKDQGTWLHPGGSLSYQVPPIQGGMLSLWLLIQPDKYNSSLSLEDMADGFLPRFFTFNGKSNIKLTRAFDEEASQKSFTPSIDFKVYLESLAALMPHINTESITEKAEKEIKDKSPKAKAEVVHLGKRDAVYVARSEARKSGVNQVDVKITDEAKHLVVSYLRERQEEASLAQVNDENDPCLGIYIRIEEMLLRFLCNAASWNARTKEAVIDKDIAMACIEFHKFNTDRFFTNELTELTKGAGERDSDILMQGLLKAYKKAGNQPVTLRDISACIKNTKRPKNMKYVLKEMVSSKEIWLQQRKHKTSENRVVDLYMPPVAENPIEALDIA